MSPMIEAARQLALLARLDYPMTDGLKAMAGASPWLGRMAEDLEAGDSLAGAARRHPRVFSPFFASMLEAAEGSGAPAATLKALSSWLERSDRLRRRVQTALFYPFLVLNALVLQVTFVLVLAAPLGVLPLLDMAVPWRPDVVVVLSVALLVALNLVARRASDFLWAGALRARAEQAVWARALGSLLGAGVEVPKALRLSSGAVELPWLREDLEAAGTELDRGRSLAEALAERPRLDPMLAWTAAAGEDREELAPLFLDAADVLDREVDRQAAQVVRLTEPVALVAVGLLVMLGLVAFWWPFYRATSGIL